MFISMICGICIFRCHIRGGQGILDPPLHTRGMAGLSQGLCQGQGQSRGVDQGTFVVVGCCDLGRHFSGVHIV